MFAVSYEMAAHRFTNLATHLLDLRCHFVRNNASGIIYKAYENDGIVFPADEQGAIEGQRMCLQWSGRQVFLSPDRFSVLLPVLRLAHRHLLLRRPRRPLARAGLRHHAGRAVPRVALVPRAGDHQPHQVATAPTATAAAARPPSSPSAGRARLAVGPGNSHVLAALPPGPSPAWTRPTSTPSWSVTRSARARDGFSRSRRTPGRKRGGPSQSRHAPGWKRDGPSPSRRTPDGSSLSRHAPGWERVSLSDGWP